MADDLQQQDQQMPGMMPGGGPPPFMASPMTGAPPASGGVLPPTNPVDATQQQGPQDPMQWSQEQGMQQLIRARAAGDASQSRIEQMGMQPGEQPPTPWAPHMVHGQGAGGFFHNLGQALMALGAATTPGQVIRKQSFEARAIPWKEEHEVLAKQVQATQDQQKLEQESMGPISNMGYHVGILQNKDRLATVAEDRVKTYRNQVASQSAHRLEQDAQGWDRLDQGAKRIKLTEWFNKEKVRLGDATVTAGLEKNRNTVAATESLAAAIGSSKYAQEHPWISQTLKAIGIDSGPEIQVPAGASTQTIKSGQAVGPNAGGPSSPRASAAPSGGVKVGQSVTIKGKSMKVTAVHPDGTFDAK